MILFLVVSPTKYIRIDVAGKVNKTVQWKKDKLWLES